MKCYFRLIKFFGIIFITFGITLNLTAQTNNKPAPYRNLSDYQDAHPKSKDIPNKPKNTSDLPRYTPENSKNTTEQSKLKTNTPL